MWVSRVEEIDAQRDNVQVRNPFMLQNNTSNFRSSTSAMNNVSRKVNAATNAAPNEIGVVVSLSGRRGETVNQATTLSGIDVSLFAAD